MRESKNGEVCFPWLLGSDSQHLQHGQPLDNQIYGNSRQQQAENLGDGRDASLAQKTHYPVAQDEDYPGQYQVQAKGQQDDIEGKLRGQEEQRGNGGRAGQERRADGHDGYHIFGIYLHHASGDHVFDRQDQQDKAAGDGKGADRDAHRLQDQLAEEQEGQADQRRRDEGDVDYLPSLLEVKLVAAGNDNGQVARCIKDDEQGDEGQE
jgi:hypothetical protein